MRGTNSSWKKCGNNIACYREGSAGFLPARLVLSSESVQICSPGFQIASTYSQLLLSICLFPQLLQTLPRSWPLVVLLGFLLVQCCPTCLQLSSWHHLPSRFWTGADSRGTPGGVLHPGRERRILLLPLLQNKAFHHSPCQENTFPVSTCRNRGMKGRAVARLLQQDEAMGKRELGPPPPATGAELGWSRAEFRDLPSKGSFGSGSRAGKHLLRCVQSSSSRRPLAFHLSGMSPRVAATRNRTACRGIRL